MFSKFLFLFLFLFEITSCSAPSEEEIFKKERDKRIYAALGKFRHSMEEKGYSVVGIGEGIDHSTGKQNYLGVTLNIASIPDIEFARMIEIEALQQLQKYVNEEAGIQDYIAEFPFPIKFIIVSFISKIRDSGICTVCNNSRDEIYYLTDEPGKPLQGPAIEVHRESYYEATQILKNQKHI